MGFRSINDGGIDTTTASGEMVFNIFAALAQFERRLIQERTQAGLKAAKARNTPTSVGKTNLFYNQENLSQKHPHERGEDHFRKTLQTSKAGNTPRAWGRRTGSQKSLSVGGNTPTSVGKTLDTVYERFSDSETPPRAWGRRRVLEWRQKQSGNTPTSVGKTLPVWP